MADVLIVCVREDEPQAKALADMFEAAGFSIGGAPNSDGALRSSGAGVVVWSQASIRSRPFLDAAQRVINANKAVVASLIEPPPPSSIGESPAFDLSRWDGDPNDPSLDPLFFAVDRMVNAARAGVGAAQRETRDYDPPQQRAPRQTALRAEPPPRRQEPPQYRAPPPPPSYRVPPQADPLGSEAEHWRAIRDSRNPADFMDYLARYGPDGAFSEVAELRLNQLTASGAAPAPSARPAVRPPPPAPRAEAPPMRRAEPPPPRREGALPPTQRRTEAPPPQRRPPIDRDYTRDLRDPPKGQGGPVRAFVLIAILGLAALVGGVYFGGGMGGPTPAAEQSGETQPAASDTATSTGDDFSGLEEAPSVPLSEAVTNRADRQTASRTPEREPQRTTRDDPPPQRTVEREQPRRDPPATTTNTSASSSGGPVTLAPNNGQSSPVPLSPAANPPPVQTANVEPSIIGSATPPQPQRAAGSVVWTQRPTARRISDLYPRSALNDGVGGRVVMECRVQGDLSVSCSVVSETPSGNGFGRAALSASSSYRARPTLSDGTSAVGSTTRIAVNFQAPQR